MATTQAKVTSPNLNLSAYLPVPKTIPNPSPVLAPMPSVTTPAVTTPKVTTPKVTTPAPSPTSSLTTPGAGYATSDQTVAAKLAQMQASVLQQASPAAASQEATRLASTPTSPYQVVGQAYNAGIIPQAGTPVAPTPTLPSSPTASVNQDTVTADPTATATAITSSPTSQYDALVSSYLDALRASQGATAPSEAQSALDELLKTQANLETSKAMGLEKIEEQPIEMDFITGQQAALQRSAGIQQEALTNQMVPLKEKLALEQSRRQAALDVASKEFELKSAPLTAASESAAKLAQLQAQYGGAQSIAAGGSLYDPQTGKIIATAPEKSLAVKVIPATKTSPAMIYDPNTETFTPVEGSKPTGTTGSGTTASNYTAQKTQLEASKGTDGFVNTDVYKTMRAAAKDKTAFDTDFAWMLNPQDPSAAALRSKSGIKAYTSSNLPTDLKAQIMRDISLGMTYTDLVNDYSDVDPTTLKQLLAASS
jgi:hypothetical protein